jgi:hypothetical protein
MSTSKVLKQSILSLRQEASVLGSPLESHGGEPGRRNSSNPKIDAHRINSVESIFDLSATGIDSCSVWPNRCKDGRPYPAVRLTKQGFGSESFKVTLWKKCLGLLRPQQEADPELTPGRLSRPRPSPMWAASGIATLSCALSILTRQAAVLKTKAAKTNIN